MSTKILVLGSGVVGLNTALQLQNDFPEAQVTIMAEKFNSELVSLMSITQRLFYRIGVAAPGATNLVSTTYYITKY